VWALGVIMYQLVTKTLPFQENQKRYTFRMIREKNPQFLHSAFRSVSENCVDLISRMLHKKPSERITVEQALMHPFFPSMLDSEVTQTLNQQATKMKKRSISQNSKRPTHQIEEEKTPRKSLVEKRSISQNSKRQPQQIEEE